MTYNPDEWEVGDLAWITTNPDHERIRNSPWAQGRMLRMVVRRHGDGSNTSATGSVYRWLEGDLHWVATNGSWIKVRPDSPNIFRKVERAIAVAPSVLAQQNDRDTTRAYPRQATSWATASGALIGSNVHITLPNPPPARMTARDLRWAQPDINLNCSSPGCPICEARRNRAVR
jgi:hypothetical protein